MTVMIYYLFHPHKPVKELEILIGLDFDDRLQLLVSQGMQGNMPWTLSGQGKLVGKLCLKLEKDLLSY